MDRGFVLHVRVLRIPGSETFDQDPNSLGLPPYGDTALSFMTEAMQLFLLVGAVALIPLILGYTSFSYWTFRGKVRTGAGYR